MSVDPVNSIVNIGELAKPATVLIEKVSAAVGCLYEPTKVKRLARAEAEAALVRAESDLQIGDLQRRAKRRWLHEEEMHQSNMEAQVASAIPLLNDQAKPEELDDDWLAHLFARSRIVKDSDMQELWARVLAGEANSPGLFSKRTINLLSELEQDDAKLFTSLNRFVWTVDQEEIPIVFHTVGDFYKNYGIDFDSLTHLESIGLVRFQSSGFGHEVDSSECIAHYFGKPLLLKLPQAAQRAISTGTTIFTQSGKELAQICGSQPVDGYFDYVKGNWRYYTQHVEDSEQKSLEREFSI